MGRPLSTTSIAVKAPMMRPVLPRTSSAASGLRFCGMIEDPVEKASESLTKPLAFSRVSGAFSQRD